ncbi:MAG: thiolase family protein [Chloroflexi bacterium]|nr:thiolase family protein [Chloroflexota bacterium]MYF65923.1 thiolase family protein [Chloroflexota bacterium]MYK35324.1 thiolase family protein [Chloroflexota bacterium]
MQDVVIVSGARTPVGRFGGAFKDLPASDLGAVAIKAAVERAGISPEDVDEVIMGNVLQADETGYTARRAMLKAGLPDHIPAMTVNRACSSGLEAINLAVQAIATGESEVVVAGGADSMSRVPYLMKGVRFEGPRMGDYSVTDGLTLGLTCPIYDYHMGVTAENVATRFEVSREAQDEMAVDSHQRAVHAQAEGYFDAQIAAVSVPQRRGDPVAVTQDEHPRADTTLEGLAKLRPIFKEGGTVTAGNSAGINDGAAAVVVMSRERAEAEGLTPRLRWVGRGVSGVDPSVMGIGPVPSTRKVLEKTGMAITDLDLVELNEAFAAQALYVIRELEMDWERTNVNGSGISLGHPVGATGAIMTVKIMEELTRTDGQFGLVTMCVGGGQGVSTIFERLN